MEENTYIKEQPEMTCSVNLAAANDENSNDESQKGSLYGKFKDANSLYSGYIELEKEFTKKSQLLSELMKSDKVDNTDKVPIYKTEDWQSKVDEYMENKPYSQNFAKEIAKTLMENEEMSCMPNCLDLAYNEVLAKKFVSAEDMVKDKDFLEKFVYQNEEIRSKILSEYLAKLHSNSAPPIVLSAKGDSVGVISPTKPKSLSEAKAIVERLFNR